MAMPERVSPKHETVMDVTVEQIARVYALAFLGAASKQPNADALVAELKSVVEDVLVLPAPHPLLQPVSQRFLQGVG